MPTSPDIRISDSNEDVWQFAECEFDDLRYELRVGGQPVEIERKPLDLLRYLLSKSGAVVKKEELLEAVWPGVLVVDASLATAVSKLRKALGDQEVIQTVSRVGYRIAVPVSRVRRANITNDLAPSATVVSTPEASSSPGPQRTRRLPFLQSSWLLWASLGGVVVAALVIGAVIIRFKKPPAAQPVSLAILPFQNVSGMSSMDYLRSALPDEIAHTLAAGSLTLRPLTASAQSRVPAWISARSVMTSMSTGL